MEFMIPFNTNLPNQRNANNNSKLLPRQYKLFQRKGNQTLASSSALNIRSAEIIRKLKGSSFGLPKNHFYRLNIGRTRVLQNSIILFFETPCKGVLRRVREYK